MITFIIAVVVFLLLIDNEFNLLKTTKEEKRKIEDFVCGAIL